MRYNVEITTTERLHGGYIASVTHGPIWLRLDKVKDERRDRAASGLERMILAFYGGKHQFTFSHVEG